MRQRRLHIIRLFVSSVSPWHQLIVLAMNLREGHGRGHCASAVSRPNGDQLRFGQWALVEMDATKAAHRPEVGTFGKWGIDLVSLLGWRSVLKQI